MLLERDDVLVEQADAALAGTARDLHTLELIHAVSVVIITHTHTTMS